MLDLGSGWIATRLVGGNSQEFMALARGSLLLVV